MFNCVYHLCIGQHADELYESLSQLLLEHCQQLQVNDLQGYCAQWQQHKRASAQLKVVFGYMDRIFRETQAK